VLIGSNQRESSDQLPKELLERINSLLADPGHFAAGSVGGRKGRLKREALKRD